MKNLLKINSNAFLLTQSFFFCLLVFMISSYGLLFSIICCLSLWIISIFINSRQGPTKSKLLDYCSLPFLIYYLIQSPVFPLESVSLEALYFGLKLLSLVAIAIQLRLWGMCSTISYFILFLFISDTFFIYLVNEGITKTRTEYFSVFESLLAALVSIEITRFFFLEEKYTHLFKRNGYILFLIGHLGNYLYAATAKIALDGGPFSWLTNQTFSTVQRAELWGLSVVTFPLDKVFTFELEYLSNVFVLVTQLISGVILFFPILLGPLAIIYDIFHLTAGLLAGPWFYKWAVINLLIFKFRNELIKHIRDMSLLTKSFLSLIFIFLYFFSSIPHLGWYEYRQGSLIYAYGIDEVGNEKRLHHQFFGSAAFTILDKNTFFIFDKLYNRQMAGLKFSEMQKANSCSRTPPRPLNQSQQLEAQERLKKIVNRFLDERSAFRRILQNIQPYHILIPNPRLQGVTSDVKFNSIKFELRNICLDENYNVTKNELVETFVIEYEKNYPDNLRWPLSIL